MKLRAPQAAGTVAQFSHGESDLARRPELSHPESNETGRSASGQQTPTALAGLAKPRQVRCQLFWQNATPFSKVAWLSTGAAVLTTCGAVALGSSWSMALPMGGAVGLVGAAAGYYNTLEPATAVTELQTISGKAPKAKKKRRPKPAKPQATRDSQVMEGAKANAAPEVRLQNRFLALLSEEAQPGEKCLTATKLEPAVAPTSSPIQQSAPERLFRPVDKPLGLRVPRQCEISKGIPPCPGDDPIFMELRPVAVRGNSVLDAIVGTCARHPSFLTPGMAFVRGTSDGGRYAFQVIGDEEKETQLYQFALHYDRRIQNFVRVNKRRVVITW